MKDNYLYSISDHELRVSLYDVLKSGYVYINQDLDLDNDGQLYHIEFFLARNILFRNVYKLNSNGDKLYVESYFDDFLFLRNSLLPFDKDYKTFDFSTLKFDEASLFVLLRDFILKDHTRIHGHIDTLQANIFNHFDGSMSSLGNSVSDLQNFISSQFSSLNSFLQNYQISPDNQPILFNKLDSISVPEFTPDNQPTLFQQLQNISIGSSIPMVSLDGAYGSYKDGSFVAVKGYNGITFKVISSFLFKNDDKNYMIAYLLQNKDDPQMSIYVPSIFVSLVQ